MTDPDEALADQVPWVDVWPKQVLTARAYEDDAAVILESVVESMVREAYERGKRDGRAELKLEHQRYTDDRLSLAQEISETLKARGHWSPTDASADLITAVGIALDKA